MALNEQSAETITVSSTAIGITSGLLTSRVFMARMQHRAGGMINHLISSTPVAGGGAGECQRTIGEEWEVWGANDLRDFKMIKQTAESDATIDVQLYGAP